MRKLILITAIVLASATAHAVEPRRLSVASDGQPAKSVETVPAEPKSAETAPVDTPKYVERPAAVDTKATQPTAPSSNEQASAQPSQTAADKPKRRHQSTASRVISELHRHGIYW